LVAGHGDDHSQMNHRKIHLFFTDKSSFSGFGVLLGGTKLAAPTPD